MLLLSCCHFTTFHFHPCIPPPTNVSPLLNHFIHTYFTSDLNFSYSICHYHIKPFVISYLLIRYFALKIDVLQLSLSDSFPTFLFIPALLFFHEEPIELKEELNWPSRVGAIMTQTDRQTTSTLLCKVYNLQLYHIHITMLHISLLQGGPLKRFLQLFTVYPFLNMYTNILLCADLSRATPGTSLVFYNFSCLRLIKYLSIYLSIYLK